MAVLAADAIGFKARRNSGGQGTTAHSNDEAAHYNDMAYRLVAGDLLMTDLLLDAAAQL
jgi:hypothetical protein